MTCGVIFVAYGPNACREALASAASLRGQYPVTTVGEVFRGIHFDDQDSRGRWAKLNLDSLSPYDFTLYLDADTRVKGDLSAGFDLLADGWDMAITASTNQPSRHGPDGGQLLWHACNEERAATFMEVGEVVQLQAGAFFFARNARVMDFFAVWRNEWQRWHFNDQAALLRALWRVPLKIWLLGRDYNGGALVEHRFGAARA